jgi:hypothetical protein
VISGTLDAAASRHFFVCKEQLNSPHSGDPAANWRGAYALNAACQPSFVPAQLAVDIFTAGKTIAFLREWCGDTQWSAAVNNPSHQLALTDGTYEHLR